MKILKHTRTAFQRQILESVIIQRERKHHLMNNKAEYNRCALPRLTAKLGEKELEKWREVDKEEMRKEASIEEKIRLRKKKMSKERAEQTRRREMGQPKRKKMRLEESDQHEQRDDQEKRELPTSPASKRKVSTSEKGRSPKKRRANDTMRKYLTCKRWKEEEEKASWEKDMTEDNGEEVGEDAAFNMHLSPSPSSPAVQQDLEEKETKVRTEQHDTINRPISPPQESSEAFARIGLVPTDEVSPKKLKTGESHQSGPAVEPMLGGLSGWASGTARYFLYSSRTTNGR
jgi:hypothetical protein